MSRETLLFFGHFLHSCLHPGLHKMLHSCFSFGVSVVKKCMASMPYHNHTKLYHATQNFCSSKLSQLKTFASQDFCDPKRVQLKTFTTQDLVTSIGKADTISSTCSFACLGVHHYHNHNYLSSHASSIGKADASIGKADTITCACPNPCLGSAETFKFLQVHQFLAAII